MSRSLKSTNQSSSRGFTIVELMIALSVLAILLLISTLVFMSLGKMYVKGNNRADTQDVARNIIQDISSQIKLGGGQVIQVQVPGSPGRLCIGRTSYNYITGLKVGDGGGTTTKHALWRDTTVDGCPSFTMGDDSPSVNGAELIPDHMRLTNFSVSPVPGKDGVFTIDVGVAYGDDDLLCVAGKTLGGSGEDCDTQQINAYLHDHLLNLKDVAPGDTVNCVGDVGQQYCAVSQLSVTVARRLAG